MVLLCTALLVGLGTTAGYGVAQGVQWVRDVWPDPVPELLADKAAPPEPLDLAGVARSCAPEVVGLDLTGGATRMTPGDPVDLTLTVTNLGRVPCLVDASPSNLQVTVTDADGERVWSSADCTGGSETPALLGQGETWEVSTRWSGSTSNAKCEGKPSEVGAGSYTLTPALGDVPGAQGDPLTLAVDAPAPERKDATADEAKGADAKGDGAESAGAKAAEKSADGEEGGAPPSGDESGEPDDGTPAAGDAVG